MGLHPVQTETRAVQQQQQQPQQPDPTASSLKQIASLCASPSQVWPNLSQAVLLGRDKGHSDGYKFIQVRQIL